MSIKTNGARPSGGSRVVVYDSLAEVEQIWRSLERDAVLTPYQRFDWIWSYLAIARPARLAIACLFRGDRPLAILPLAVDRAFGLSRARIIGSHLANADWLILDAKLAHPVTKQDLEFIFSHLRVGPHRVDFVQLNNMPAVWDGAENPLLQFPHHAAPDHLFRGELTRDATIRISAKRLRNIRRGRKRLEENYGPVKLVRARTSAQVTSIHQTFLSHRDRRFHEMGIANPFARKPLRQFLPCLTEASLSMEQPALVMHALMAGEHVLATSVGSISGCHYSQYINSTVDGPAARCSLTSILMQQLVEELWETGVRSVDLGIGSFDYKLDWAEQEPVYDSFIPLTLPARIFVKFLMTAANGKRAIKQDPRLWAAARRLRSILHGVRHGAPRPGPKPSPS